MLDVAWPELLVIGAVALVAIGPKDLPRVMHSMGKVAGKASRAAREVRDALHQLSYEAEVAERLRKDSAREKTDYNKTGDGKTNGEEKSEKD